MAGKLKGVDIRATGSGNIGAANAFRALGWVGGSLVLLGDAAKGWICVWLAHWCSGSGIELGWMQVIFGLAGILGHNYSIFLGFKGGKGIATSLGVLLFLDWQVALACLLWWAAVVFVTRYPSVGSLSAAILVPVLFYVKHRPMPYLSFAILACLVAIYAHRKNLIRLVQGKENRWGVKAQKGTVNDGNI